MYMKLQINGHRIWLGILMEYTLSITFFYQRDLNNPLIKKSNLSFTRTRRNVGSIVWLWPHIRKKNGQIHFPLELFKLLFLISKKVLK